MKKKKKKIMPKSITKKSAFLFNFRYLMLVAILIVIFLYSPCADSLKPTYVTYEFASNGDVLKGDVKVMQPQYAKLQELLYINWEPPPFEKVDIEYPLYFRGHSVDTSFPPALERSISRALYNSNYVPKSYVAKNADYTVVFQYDPALRNSKNVYISKILERRESMGLSIFMGVLFVLALFSVIFLSIMKVCDFKPTVEKIKTYFKTGSETNVNPRLESIKPLALFLALLLFAMALGADAISEGRSYSFSLQGTFIYIFYYLIFAAMFSSWMASTK